MKFRNNVPSVEEVKNTDMVGYLSNPGVKPVKTTRIDYWYLSPFKKETALLFNVNRNINRWYDFEGKGGNIIDFGVLYCNCSVKELLIKFSISFSFQQQSIEVNREDQKAKKIKVIKERKISSFALVRYLRKSRILLEIACKFCCEINQKLYGKNYFASDFKNYANRYKIDNEKFKARSSSKDIALTENNAETISVFEGFCNFLSYQSIHQKQEQLNTNFCILNSTSFLEKSLPLMHSHQSVHLYLDCDTTGQKCIQEALEINAQNLLVRKLCIKMGIDGRGISGNHKNNQFN